MSYLEEYCEKVLQGEINSCHRIKQVCTKLLHDIDNPDRWHFDEDIALRHINFIERFCYIPSGDIGRPFKLELFQKAWLEAAFGFVDDDDLRKYNEVMVVCGRKNGKTSLLSAILIDMLMNDREGAPQCLTASTKLDQSKLSFNAACRMIQQSPMLSSNLKKRQADIYFPYNMGYIKALANNQNSLDGLDIHCCVCDELAAWKDRSVYDLLRQAMSARKQALLFIITTNGFVRQNIFDDQYNYGCDILDGKATNERFLPFFYELDNIDEWDDPEAWVKANPGLGAIKSIEYMQDVVQKAKDDPSFKPSVLTKEFDMKQTAESSWLTFEETMSAESDLDGYKFDYCIGGFDAADTTDLNAATALCMRPGDEKIYRRSMYWIPESVILEAEREGDRRGRDSAPYQLWIDQGYMRTCPGNKCDKHIFLDWFRELKYSEDLYPLYIGYDPWHIDDSLLKEFTVEFGPASMIPVRQGVITLSEPMKNTKADLQAKRIVFDNPIDQWCLINTHVKTDVNGNIQPVKSADRTQRIDGTAAYLDAYKVLQDKMSEYLNLNQES